MTPNCINYFDGYEFQLAESACVESEITPATPVKSAFYSIDCDGRVIARKGYAWDGITGPMFNTHSFMRAALFHDVICQAINDGLLDPMWRPAGDALFRQLAKRDGAGWLRVWYAHRAVSIYTKIRNGTREPAMIHSAP